MDKIYQFKDLIELVPFEPKALSQQPKWDIYGDEMFVCVATVDGVWLCKFGGGFDERSERGLIGLSLKDMAENRIDGVGIVYGMKDGRPLLPLPFTLLDFSNFNQRVAGMVTRVNQRGEHTGKWLAKIRKRKSDAIDLAMVILYGDLPMNVEIYLPVPGTAPEQASKTPVVTTGDRSASSTTFIHSTKTRRDSLTPVIEQAQKKCNNPRDTAEVWSELLVLAEKKKAPLIGATEEGLQYLKNGEAAIFKRDALRKRLDR